MITTCEESVLYRDLLSRRYSTYVERVLASLIRTNLYTHRDNDPFLTYESRREVTSDPTQWRQPPVYDGTLYPLRPFARPIVERSGGVQGPCPYSRVRSVSRTLNRKLM